MVPRGTDIYRDRDNVFTDVGKEIMCYGCDR